MSAESLNSWQDLRASLSSPAFTYNAAAGGSAELLIGSNQPEMLRAMSMSKTGLPIACDLNALTAPERDRRRKVLGVVARTIIGRSELADGFELSFDPAKLDLAMLGEWIALERRCCPFLHFRIDIGPSDRTVLALTGGPGVKEFLRAEMSS